MRRSVVPVLAGGLSIAASAPAGAWTTERVSVGPHGVQAEGGKYGSFAPAISADGRFVPFWSLATNLVPHDTNRCLDDEGHYHPCGDVFVRDRLKGTTERVSVFSAGKQGNGDSTSPVLSAGGRYVAFESNASNLVPGDSNGATDVFVRDRLMGQTKRMSVSSAGVQGNDYSFIPAISADGRFVAFESQAHNLVPGGIGATIDVFVHDRLTGRTEQVSVSSTGAKGDDESLFPSISADGRSVAFSSFATNLVPGDTNGEADVFVRTR